MNNIKIFDPLKIPITGINLIEASAGTGKTYSISALFSRLIALENFEIDKILIVTFTKDSTAELKIRLRANLLEILNHLNNKNCKSEDNFINDLISSLSEDKKYITITKIIQALNSFDNANIFTIHGFCLKILKNYPHLCNYPSQINLNDNENYEQILKITHEFWIKNILNDEILLNLFFEKKIKAENMLDSIYFYINKPYIEYKKPTISINDIPQINNEIDQKKIDITQNQENIKQSFKEISNFLNKNKLKEDKIDTLIESIIQNDSDYYKNEKNNKYLQKLNKLIIKLSFKKEYKNQEINNEILNNLNKLYEFGKLLNKESTLINEIILLKKFDLLEYINSQLKKIKINSNNRNYDDLLFDLYSCLYQNNYNSEILINILKNTWNIILIDEFQDTDKLQYGIFKKIFIDNKITTFLVGDPKQAIYKFRGADIFTYLNSIKDVDNFYTLNVNYRSNENIVNTINFIFNQRELPFVLENINYTEINASKKSSNFLCKKEQERKEKDINIIYVDKNNENNKENKDDAQKQVAFECAQKINYLLNEYNDLKTSDIAVLVSNHKEASLINNALKKFKINSITINKESIFNSDEAYAINSMLEFWLNIQDISNLSFLLTSCIFNYTEKDLKNIIEDNQDNKLDSLMEISKKSKDILMSKGFYNAFNFFESKLNIFCNLLSLNKERTITNINHIIEILSQQEAINHNHILTIEWFKNNIGKHKNNNNKIFSNDKYLLKLEKDDILIKIVTIHSAKGLQYPIVFCPFLWSINSSNTKDDSLIIINKDSKTILTTQNNENGKIINDENLSENLRLIYVALTRAKEKLYIYIKQFKFKNDNNQNYPFKYLFANNLKNNEYSWDAWKNWYEKIKCPEYINIININDNIIQSYIQNKNIIQEIDFKEPLKFTRKNLHYTKKTSFSFIIKSTNIHDYSKNDLIIDDNEIETSKENSNIEITDIFSFPRGINTGLCWHSILEKFDFGQDADKQIDLIKSQLSFYDLKDDIFLDITKNMLNNIRLCELNNNTYLYNIKNYVPEVKFLLKINNLNFKIIKKWLSKQYVFQDTNIIEYFNQINLNNIECFLEGFIDLIFMDEDKNLYLIDYKSNYLGNTIEEYNLNNLNTSMLENHYYLQALIYSLSLYRYLLYNEFKFDSIKIRYIYLRGLSQNTANGIWKWDLKKDDLDILNDQLS